VADALETYRTITPYLVVADADAELKFVTAAFGATELLCHRDEKNAVMHAEFKIGDSQLMLGQAGDQMKALTAALYLWVANVDDVCAQALAAGAKSLSTPEDKPYGHRNTWWIGSPVR
jgi:PhnB protein